MLRVADAGYKIVIVWTWVAVGVMSVTGVTILSVFVVKTNRVQVSRPRPKLPGRGIGRLRRIHVRELPSEVNGRPYQCKGEAIESA